MIYLIVILLLLGSMILYLKVANKYLIYDEPNHRSSHTTPTIRGGGVVFVFSIFIVGLLYPSYWLPVLGAVIIGTISFFDDRLELSRLLRFFFHLVSVTLIFIYLQMFSTIPFAGVITGYVFAVGIINAYNFMDGINGITGLYSLVVLGGLQYVNLYQINYIEQNLIWFPMLACLVFLYYNLRIKAKVFAGDVGSITIAFWIVFLLLNLMWKSNNWEYILFLTVYGIDTVFTIIHRLFMKQNIFKPHRLHFYQILANEQKIPHYLVSVLYAVTQFLIIGFILLTEFNFFLTLLISTLPLILMYVIMKPKFI